MSRRGGRLAIALLVVVALGAPAAADRKKALTYFRSGEKAYQAQSFEAAALSFDEAYKELPLPEIAFSAAQAFRRAHRVKPNPAYVVRAIELYQFYLANVQTGGRVGDAADSLEDMLRELDKLGAASKPPPVEPKTRLGITVALAGEATGEALREVVDATRVTSDVAITTKIDGAVVPPDTLVEVAPGTHVIRVEAPGFASTERKERAVHGASNLVPVELQPLPARLTIRTEEGAQLSLDGRAVIAGASLELPAGRHRLTIARTGRVPIAKELVLARDQTLVLDQPLAATTRRRAVKWVLGTSGLLALGAVGTGLAALHYDGVASDRLGELTTGSQRPELGARYAVARDARERYVTTTWVLGGAAVALGLAAGALYYFDDPAPEELRITPVAGAGVGGAAVSGRF